MDLRILSAAAGGLLVASLAAGPASATIARSGSVDLQAAARATLEFNQAPATVDPSHGDSWTGAPRFLTASAAAAQTGGTDTVTAHGQILANWASADAGSVSIEDYGWTVAANDPSITLVSPSVTAGFTGPFDWSYQFTATRDGRFDLNLDLIGAGDDLFGLGAWDLNFADGAVATETELLRGYFNAPTDEITASFSHDLIAGHTYTVGLRNLDGFSTAGVTTNSSVVAQEGGVMFWAITPAGVPEPSAWGLAVAGFGLAGAALRRRRGHFSRAH